MIYIAHRGNVDGCITLRENTLSYIHEALDDDFYVEVDVRWNDARGRFVLGHDIEQEDVSIEFLKHPRIVCHAKDAKALDYLFTTNVHCFWHQNDDRTLTSKGWIWTYPGKLLTPKSIFVMPELAGGLTIETMPMCLGICSDLVKTIRNMNK